MLQRARLFRGSGGRHPGAPGVTRGALLPLVFGVVGTAILLALGTWQVQRLEWKLGVIDQIEARRAAAPIAVPEAPDPEAHRYLRVHADGVLLPGELHVYTSVPPHGVGYRVIAPFEIAGGRRILLDRGFVPVEAKDAERATGPLAVEGALDWPRETDRFTAAPDRAANIWFARAPGPMAEALGTEPVMLVATRTSSDAEVMPLPVTVDIRNPHLEYAVTWYGLAAAWAMMTVYWLWRIRRRTD